MLPLLPVTVLTVNLSTGKIVREEIADEAVLKKYIGGMGLATYLFMKRYSPFLDPWSENSAIVFASGTITGTGIPSSGRVSVVFKSPVTGRYFKASAGGGFGNQLKTAGVDILLVEGKAERPVYINICDDNVEIRDAAHLWGKDVRETNRLIREELHDPEVQVVSIGPAGENRVLYASLQVSIYNSASRGGAGAVLGSKNLKAVAVRGTHYIEVAQPDRFDRVARRVTRKMFEAPGVSVISDFGTSPASDSLNLFTACHFRNFQENHVDPKDVDRLTGNYLVESGLLKRRVGCYSCPIGCHRFVTIDDGPYRGTYTGGPEYETLAAFGPCEISTEAVVKANEMCNLLGLDTISTGSCIQWLMECKQRGVVTDEMADGLDLGWGHDETVIRLIRKIAYREGIGSLLAEGTKRASEQLGSNSYKWAIQARGLEQSAIDTRFATGYALAFAVNPRGPDHLNTECLAEFGGNSEADGVIKHITGSEEYAYPFTTDKRAEIVRWHEDIYAVSDCMGMCAFSTTAQFWMNEEDLAEIFSASTGVEIDAREIMEAGKRTITLQRLYNAMLGHTREEDVLPYRFMNEVKTITIESSSTIAQRIPESKDTIPQIRKDEKGLVHISSINSTDVLDTMKDEYYRLHGWDLSTGWPTLKTLEELGLGEFSAEALKHIKLSEA